MSEWKPVKGKANIFVHDDCPCCEVEIIACEHQITYHRVACRENLEGHEAAEASAREEHRCPECEESS